MKRETKVWYLILAIAVFVLCNFLPIEKQENGKLLADWIKLHLRLVRTSNGVAHVAFSRHFSYTAIAFYESVVSGNANHRSLGTQLQNLPTLPAFNKKEKYMAVAGSNSAYAAMLRYFYSKNTNAQLIDSLEKVNKESFKASGYDDQSIRASEDYGKLIAQHIIAWAEKDGADQTNNFAELPSMTGGWQPTPPGFVKPAVPHWQNNKTLVEGSTRDVYKNLKEFPSYSSDKSSAYYKMVNEVYEVSQNLTEEQKEIALFWDDSPTKYLTVSGHWSSILAQVIQEKSLPLDVSAVAYVKCHIALNDAAIAAWYGKYTYMVARPITNIHAYIAPGWSPFIVTPPHPEFPAAHATLSAAAASGLTQALGNLAFTDNSYTDLGMKARSFQSFEMAAKEAGLSRLYGGIHYRHSIDEGLTIGNRVANNALQRLKFEK